VGVALSFLSQVYTFLVSIIGVVHAKCAAAPKAGPKTRLFLL